MAPGSRPSSAARVRPLHGDNGPPSGATRRADISLSCDKVDSLPRCSCVCAAASCRSMHLRAIDALRHAAGRRGHFCGSRRGACVWSGTQRTRLAHRRRLQGHDATDAGSAVDRPGWKLRLRIHAGASHLVYAYRDKKDGTWKVSLCSRTTTVDRAREDLAALNALRAKPRVRGHCRASRPDSRDEVLREGAQARVSEKVSTIGAVCRSDTTDI